MIDRDMGTGARGEIAEDARGRRVYLRRVREKKRGGGRGEREKGTGKQAPRDENSRCSDGVDGVARFTHDAPSLLNYVARDVYFRCFNCALRSDPIRRPRRSL